MAVAVGAGRTDRLTADGDWCLGAGLTPSGLAGSGDRP